MPHQPSGMLTRRYRHQFSRISSRIRPPIWGSSRPCASTSLSRCARPTWKKLLGRVIDEPLHGVRAERPVDHGLADLRQAIWKCQQEFPRGHVVEGEALDQCGRAVFLGQAPFPDRDVVARDPRTNDQQESQRQTPVRSEADRARGAAMKRAPRHDQHRQDQRQHLERRPRQTQKPSAIPASAK